MIVIIDMGMGNIRSLEYKLSRSNFEVLVSSKIKDLTNASRLILPGVGHFKTAMRNLKEKGLDVTLNNLVIKNKIPILGICLGMQLFTKDSEEGNVEGLGWLNAHTKKFIFGNNSDYKVPHVGWNKLKYKNSISLLSGLPKPKYYYFTHSYYVDCLEERDIVAKTSYGFDFVSMVCKENIVGTQFHPEKSHKEGFKIVERFCSGKY